MKNLNIPEFSEERIQKLYQYIEAKRQEEKEGRMKLEALFDDLLSDGVEKSSIEKIKNILNKIPIEYADKGFNLSDGISRHQGQDSDFPEIHKRYKAFDRHIKGIRTVINNINSVMETSLKNTLTNHQNDEVIENIKKYQQESLDLYTKALSYGLFKMLIEMDWNNGSKISKAPRKSSLFNYVTYGDTFNIYDYFQTKPLKSNSHIWQGLVEELDQIFNPIWNSKNKSAKTIASILCLQFPTIFQEPDKLSSNIRRRLKPSRLNP